ncbi:hypothetical protein DPMN_004495 [Dreissena polymorpha]|uniref:Uncharacterized protein n=1 Tax=Dreissena polymorpha TaxID=45954 RepID=A0A9D4MNM7_DREPO|nr:hypothetical protein DPMN_004495 [Dreissena polymorpha]
MRFSKLKHFLFILCLKKNVGPGLLCLIAATPLTSTVATAAVAAAAAAASAIAAAAATTTTT